MECDIILFISDGHCNIDFVQKIPAAQYHILINPHEQEAARVIKKNCINLVFIFHSPPQIDGIEMLHHIKQRFPLLPVVLLAAEPESALIITAFRSGAADFLNLPVEEQEFRECVTRIKAGNPELFIKNRGSPAAFSAFWAQQKYNWRRFSSFLFRPFFPSGILKHDPQQAKKLRSESLQSPEPLSPPLKKTRKSAENLPTATTPQLQIFFLGKFRVLVNSRPIKKWPSRKVRELLAYLAFHHKNRIPRDVLMDKFWHHLAPSSARNCLHVDVHGIRHLLQEYDRDYEYLLFHDECYYFNPEVEIWLDVEEFQRHWQKGQSLEQGNMNAAVSEYQQAAKLYTGDFMEENIYEDWLALDRENLKETYLIILDKLSKFYFTTDKISLAIDLCEKILKRDCCREDIHRRLMECYYKIGRRYKALRQFTKCQQALEKELGIKPTQKTVELYQKIKQDS